MQITEREGDFIARTYLLLLEKINYDAEAEELAKSIVEKWLEIKPVKE